MSEDRTTPATYQTGDEGHLSPEPDSPPVSAAALAYWRERALKAEGWTGAEEYDAFVMQPEEPKVFLIWDARTIVGNTPLFWMPKSAGYGSVISEVGRYTEEEAARKRDTDVAVPLRMAIDAARPRIDVQLLHSMAEMRGVDLRPKHLKAIEHSKKNPNGWRRDYR